MLPLDKRRLLEELWEQTVQRTWQKTRRIAELRARIKGDKLGRDKAKTAAKIRFRTILVYNLERRLYGASWLCVASWARWAAVRCFCVCGNLWQINTVYGRVRGCSSSFRRVQLPGTQASTGTEHRKALESDGIHTVCSIGKQSLIHWACVIVGVVSLKAEIIMQLLARLFVRFAQIRPAHSARTTHRRLAERAKFIGYEYAQQRRSIWQTYW